jgi:3-phosphoshikimate 1-carboxyvinyltransferase
MLQGLNSNSTQPDTRALQLMQPLGLCWEDKDGGLLVWRDWEKPLPESLRYDLSDCPDLAPTLLVLCACLQVKLLLTGVQHLQHKESDRLQALQNELSKVGALLIYDYRSAMLAEGIEKPTNAVVELQSWQDHRIVMALSLLSAKGWQLQFDNAGVVSKSYPAFWEDLASFGFELQ